jgi:hypothetical protein
VRRESLANAPAADDVASSLLLECDVSSTRTRRAAGPSDHGADGPGSFRVLTWVPVLVLAVGLLRGVALWDRWGLVIALERVVQYCF